MENLWLVITLFSCVYPYSYGYFFPNVYPRLKLDAKIDSDAGDPLLLTPYIERGAIEEAQKLSTVGITQKIGFRSHAGFFTVDKRYDSNLYFWYFPPFYDHVDSPVILWLQGGPGGSSLYGLFAELGPLIVKKDGLALRKYHWALTNHLIFIDNPVGTGFSFTRSSDGFCTDEECVARNLYNALQQYFTMFPELRHKKFFLSGESYAGKYIPSLGVEIHQQNLNSKNKINLMGMIIGNGYCDPVNQLDYGNYLYQHGLLDDNQLKVFLKYEKQIAKEIRAEKYIQADLLMDKLMDGVFTNNSFYKNFTGFTNYYNYLISTDDEEQEMLNLMNLLQNDKIRNSVHVGGLPFHNGNDVAIHLSYDMMKSVVKSIEFLLNLYPMLFYSGQLDIVVAYPLMTNFLRNLKFSAAEQYKTAPRMTWYVDNELAGYVKKAGNLTEVLVRNAGHMVPKDQPKWALELVNKFVTNGF